MNFFSSIFKKLFVCSLLLCTTRALDAQVTPVYPKKGFMQWMEEISKEADAIETNVLRGLPEGCDVGISSLPFTITAPGVYCLLEDVTVPTGEIGITIQSEDVVLDLRGYEVEITCEDGAKETIFVDGVGDVVIENGIIEGCDDGDLIFVGPSSYDPDSRGPVKLCNLVLTGPGSSGNGVRVSGSQKVVLGCIESSFFECGFKIEDSSDCVIRECEALNNTTGFCIADDATLNFFDRCLAQSNTNEGFKVEGDKNVFERCTAAFNDFGFSLLGDNNVLFKCIGNSNTTKNFDLQGSENQNACPTEIAVSP